MNVEIQRDGLVLRGRLEKPEKEKCPIAILFHGFTGNLAPEQDSLFSRLSRRLNAAGIAAVRFDFNGHGQSDGDFSRMDVLNELEDALAILAYVRSLAFGTEIYLVGHSQGGVVASMLAGYYPDVVKKLVLLAPAATLKDDAQKGTCMGTVYSIDHTPEVVEIGPEKHPVGGHYFRIAKSLPIYEIASLFTGKALAIHGKADTIVDPIASVRYANRLPDCKLQLFEGMDHGIGGEHQLEAMEMAVDFLKN